MRLSNPHRKGRGEVGKQGLVYVRYCFFFLVLPQNTHLFVCWMEKGKGKGEGKGRGVKGGKGMVVEGW